VAFAYAPGSGDMTRIFTGGDRYRGRLAYENGHKGQIRVRLTTISSAPPRPLPPSVDPVPPDPGPAVTATPTPVPTPTPSPTSVPSPTVTPTPTGKPDLVITSLGTFSITLKNQGSAAAGPFSVTATTYPKLRVQALGAGASVTIQSGHNCQEGSYHAFVDSGSEVAESNENNNTADAQQIC
jgi:heme-binding NEAT domain protein